MLGKTQKLLFGVLIALFTVACTSNTNHSSHSKNHYSNTSKPAKYVFYFIGDGMTTPQILLADAALKNKDFRAQYNRQTGENITQDSLCFRHFPAAGMATTNAENRYITGSAAAATALSTGFKTTINTIGKSGDHSHDLITLGERAKNVGKKVGVLTSVSVDHATPAGFYAHVKSRSEYETISNQMITSCVDFFGGGSVNHGSFKKETFKEYKAKLKEAGIHYTTTRKELEALNSESGRVFATIALHDSISTDGSTLPYSIDLDLHQNDNNRITLADFTRTGIRCLDNPKGFFMMVEGGKIDWSCHANDAVTAIYEVIAFDQAIQEAVKFYNQHPDETLIVVTGDHETGGLSLGYAGTHYESLFHVLSHQKVSWIAYNDTVASWRKQKNFTFEQALKSLEENYGLNVKEYDTKLSKSELADLRKAFNQTINTDHQMTEEERQLYYGYYDPFTVSAVHLVEHKAGLNYGSFSHTALPACVFALGEHANAFTGFYDNTDIPRIITEIAKYQSFK